MCSISALARPRLGSRPAQNANSGQAGTRRETPTPAYLGASCLAVSCWLGRDDPPDPPLCWPGLAPAPSGSGVILRNCLFIDRSRKTSATPMAATTMNPSTPGSTSLLAEEDAATAASTPNVKGSPSPGYPRTGYPRAGRYPRLT